MPFEKDYYDDYEDEDYDFDEEEAEARNAWDRHVSYIEAKKKYENGELSTYEYHRELRKIRSYYFDEDSFEQDILDEVYFDEARNSDGSFDIDYDDDYDW